MKSFLLLVAVIGTVSADVYFHNPRGSNNRVDGGGREVSNNRRLFNSQNNNRGGYLAGNMYYYQGTVLPIEWTNQHSCNNPNNNCELVIQYMCGPLVRDGAIRTTIPERARSCTDKDCGSLLQFGMHEDHLNYLRCRTRRRNKGLFTADQNLNRDDARFTRQNANGQRRGYECPEERDYYPYWHPTQWKDIVVMTNNVSRCKYYQTQSENVIGRGECVFDKQVYLDHAENSRFRVPNNKAECETYTFQPRRRSTVYRGKWVESPSHNIKAPECIQTPWSRDNHLGNGYGGQHNVYNWTLPKLNDQCVLRIRYNISTSDFDSWSVDSKYNGGPDANNIDIGSQYNLDQDNDKGYVYENNPTVEIYPGVKLNLAINTAQFGRTFQDRSFTFTVKERSGDLVGANIHNVNVRGKRGNIVEVYPSVEYDFVPNTLYVKQNDMIHFQWTGSDNNPGGNDGQGRARTDRSNIISLGPEVYHEQTLNHDGVVISDLGRNYPAMLGNTSFLGLSFEDKKHLAIHSYKQIGGDMDQLNDAGTYFDLGPKKVTKTGIFRYFSTRNNAFTNRCQKAKIIVQ